MTESRLKRTERGFDCDFVEKPPTKYIQLECPVCLQILREPFQAPCCGKSYCRVCIEKVQADEKPCPTCNEENLVIFHNKGLQSTLYECEVYCPHKEDGCEWKGELSGLDKHLSTLQPLAGCQFSEIECKFCCELVNRPKITTHEKDLCPKRPFNCQYCTNFNSTYEDVINNHWPVCGYYPVQCTEGCGTTLQRQLLEEHIAKDCPMKVIDCDFHPVGCDVKLPRKNMPAHLKAGLITHVSLQTRNQVALANKVEHLEKKNKTLEQQVTDVCQKNEALRQNIIAVHQEIKKMKLQVASVEHQFRSHAGIAPCDLFLLNFELYKFNHRIWISPSFYSQRKGYKFCLSVNTTNRNTHLSVYVCMMKGEFDDKLHWPFRGTITIWLVDQTTEKADYGAKLVVDNCVTNNFPNRVTKGERNDGWGFPEFITPADLQPKYLKNNSLHFRVTVYTLM